MKSITMKLVDVVVVVYVLKILVITAFFGFLDKKWCCVCGVFLHKSSRLRIWIGAIDLLVVKRKKSLLWLFECTTRIIK